MVDLALALQASEWSARHAEDPWWRTALAFGGPIAIALVIAASIARAWAQRGRYRAGSALTDADRAALHEAVRTAERRTVGEIVPVVVERSDEHVDARWRAAVAFALAASLAFVTFGSWPMLAGQVGLGLTGYLLALALPGVARLFASERRATHVVEEQAVQEFQRLGLYRTEARTGVLIFVSLFERRAVVLGDRGIDAAVQKDHWADVDRAILAGIERGSLAQGLVEGVRLAGERLAAHFPWREGDRNELPDRVIVRASGSRLE